MLEGEVTVKTDEGEIILKKYDSVYLAPERGSLHPEPHQLAGDACSSPSRTRSPASSEAGLRERLPGPPTGTMHAPASGGREGDGRLSRPSPRVRAARRPRRRRHDSAVARTRDRPATDQTTSEEATCPTRSSPPRSPGPVATKADNAGMPGHRGGDRRRRQGLLRRRRGGHPHPPARRPGQHDGRPRRREAHRRGRPRGVPRHHPAVHRRPGSSPTSSAWRSSRPGRRWRPSTRAP